MGALFRLRVRRDLDVVRAAATRGAYSTHHCRACGRVVCAFCAPAADSVAADALGRDAHVAGQARDAPSGVVWGLSRVCRPCHFRAYDL